MVYFGNILMECEVNINCYLPHLTSTALIAPPPASVGGFDNTIKIFLETCISEIHATFNSAHHSEGGTDPIAPEKVLKILLSHEFNYQSKGRTKHLHADLLKLLGRVIASGKKIPIYFLFRGGYRAAVGGEPLAHVFAPDITELMLIYQVARLERRIREVYPPGVSFSIVINNGVAAFTNGIAYACTNDYVRRLRQLIGRLGAQETVWVLNQSELGSFEDRMHGIDIVPKPEISPVDHGVVQRFLGRTCTVEEACLKIATYEKAEMVWGTQVRAIVAADGGIFCRQVAHPACLSFRPFPGGAIRVQNGTLAFRLGDAGPVPVFVTPLTWAREQPVVLPMHLALFDGVSAASEAATETARVPT